MARKIEQRNQRDKEEAPALQLRPSDRQPSTWDRICIRARTFLLGGQGSHALSGAWRTEKINRVSTSLLRAGLVRAGGALISRWATEPIWRLEIDRGGCRSYRHHH